MASNLSVLREKAKTTQEDLADALGLSRQTISAIENEKRAMLWSTFMVLTLVSANNFEVKKIMDAIGIINDDIEKALNIRAIKF